MKHTWAVQAHHAICSEYDHLHAHHLAHLLPSRLETICEYWSNLISCYSFYLLQVVHFQVPHEVLDHPSCWHQCRLSSDLTDCPEHWGKPGLPRYSFTRVWLVSIPSSRPTTMSWRLADTRFILALASTVIAMSSSENCLSDLQGFLNFYHILWLPVPYHLHTKQAQWGVGKWKVNRSKETKSWLGR